MELESESDLKSIIQNVQDIDEEFYRYDILVAPVHSVQRHQQIIIFKYTFVTIGFSLLLLRFIHSCLSKNIQSINLQNPVYKFINKIPTVFGQADYHTYSLINQFIDNYRMARNYDDQSLSTIQSYFILQLQKEKNYSTIMLITDLTLIAGILFIIFIQKMEDEKQADEFQEIDDDSPLLDEIEMSI